VGLTSTLGAWLLGKIWSSSRHAISSTTARGRAVSQGSRGKKQKQAQDK
jgi:hypothetical protein